MTDGTDDLPDSLAASEPAPAAARRRRLPLALVATGALALALLAGVVIGANYPDDPNLEGSSDQAAGGPSSRVPGFGEVSFRVQPGTGGQSQASEFCALLAESGDQHAKGLMGRRDLAGYDAMVFRFGSDSSSPFYMRNVPIPLTVAWFDSSGTFVSALDMAPCGDSGDCPRYFPTRPYRFAVEVPQGGLARLGVGPGSVLSVGGSCPSH